MYIIRKSLDDYSMTTLRFYILSIRIKSFCAICATVAKRKIRIWLCSNDLCLMYWRAIIFNDNLYQSSCKLNVKRRN